MLQGVFLYKKHTTLMIHTTAVPPSWHTQRHQFHRPCLQSYSANEQQGMHCMILGACSVVPTYRGGGYIT